LRILIYDIGTARIDAGYSDLMEIPVLGEGTLALVHSELVDYQSRPYVSLSASRLPENYELKQNYPNPLSESVQPDHNHQLRFADRDRLESEDLQHHRRSRLGAGRLR